MGAVIFGFVLFIVIASILSSLKTDDEQKEIKVEEKDIVTRRRRPRTEADRLWNEWYVERYREQGRPEYSEEPVIEENKIEIRKELEGCAFTVKGICKHATIPCNGCWYYENWEKCNTPRSIKRRDSMQATLVHLEIENICQEYDIKIEDSAVLIVDSTNKVRKGQLLCKPVEGQRREVLTGTAAEYYMLFPELPPYIGINRIVIKPRFQKNGNLVHSISNLYFYIEQEEPDIPEKVRIAGQYNELDEKLPSLYDSYGRRKRMPIPRTVVDEVYRRDGGVCVYCGSVENIQLDHIIPHSKGGADTFENLQLLCQKCNIEKSNSIG